MQERIVDFQELDVSAFFHLSFFFLSLNSFFFLGASLSRLTRLSQSSAMIRVSGSPPARPLPHALSLLKATSSSPLRQRCRSQLEILCWVHAAKPLSRIV